MDKTPDKTLVKAFPTPDTPPLRAAYRDLYLAAEGTAAQKRHLGDPADLPRPWDPATCRDPLLRQDVWDWLEAVVAWFNREYVWDPNAGMIPACWPLHPHLVHEIAVLADQRRRAGMTTTSDLLEDWHRYAVPAFTERMRTRMKNQCDDTHSSWPARGRHTRLLNDLDGRRLAFCGDVTALTQHLAEQHRADLLAPPPPPGGPTTQTPILRIVEAEEIDPDTGEIL
ncbi:hypothetical protein [Propioniciclava soli]|uniref:hypothetical protein n=1 Tax=Propioniciclava soli TaxID=2775081 RepID=UPI001E37BC2E|nr:hypothetical protein [Propioniciclava soli]